MNKTEYNEYRGLKLVDIPSDLGGVFPAAIVEEGTETVKALCLHPEFFKSQILSRDAAQIKPLSYRLTAAMKRIIERYNASK